MKRNWNEINWNLNTSEMNDWHSHKHVNGEQVTISIMTFQADIAGVNQSQVYGKPFVSITGSIFCVKSMLAREHWYLYVWQSQSCDVW